MGIERLLERLINRHRAQNDDLTQAPAQTDEQRLVRSVTDHLLRILNTRQGTAPADPAFGIPDLSDLPGEFASPETERIRQIIAKAVERYEPRIKEVEVSFEGSTEADLALRFSLSGIIVHEERRIPLRLLTRMMADSQFEIGPEINDPR